MLKTKNDAILIVKDLSKTYDGAVAVECVCFSVNKGEVFGILGPNGAGKTTTLEMIEGLREPDSGEIKLAGIDRIKEPNKVKSVIGVQLQTSAFFDHLFLPELLEMFASLYHTKIDALELLREVDLEEKAKSFVKQLSGGQKQRFSIAAALVNKPKILFLDEPTTGLDPQARRNLWDLIKTIKKRGITVVITTHYMDEAEKLCDRVAIMDHGRIVTMASPKTLVAQLLKRGFKKEVKVQQANLEDVFIDITGHKLRD